MDSGREPHASTGALSTTSSHLKPSSTSGPTVRPPCEPRPAVVARAFSDATIAPTRAADAGRPWLDSPCARAYSQRSRNARSAFAALPPSGPALASTRRATIVA
eukprot:5036960-Prymnesium_polylepis.1